MKPNKAGHSIIDIVSLQTWRARLLGFVRDEIIIVQYVFKIPEQIKPWCQGKEYHVG